MTGQQVGTPKIAVPDGLPVPEAASRRIAELEEKVAQLETALQSRIVIEQAKGILADRLATDVDEAFELLRQSARSHRMRLHDLAARVIRERETPAPVVITVARRQRLRAAWLREVAEAHRARVEELRRAWEEQVSRLDAKASR